MNHKPNRICAVCGSEYHYCHSCGHQDPLYKNVFCSDECRQLFHLCVSYNAGRIDDEVFKAKFAMLNLDVFGDYLESIQRVLHRVYPETRTDIIAYVPEEQIDTD